MSALEQELQPGEWFIFSGTAHWIRYALPALPLVGGVALWVFEHPVAAVLTWVLAGAIALPLILEAIRSRFIVTNKRVILKRGMFREEVESVPLTDIADIAVHHDGIGRLLKAGRIRLDTIDGRRRALPWMERARTFRRLALEQQRTARLAAEGKEVPALPAARAS